MESEIKKEIIDIKNDNSKITKNEELINKKEIKIAKENIENKKIKEIIEDMETKKWK